MASAQQVFDRHEKKYMVTPQQFSYLQKALAPYFTMDQYGLHTICSVYYDTDDFSVIRLSNEKPVYKEKLRLRCYLSPGGPLPGPDSPVFLELKKKFKGVVNKRRIPLTLGEARAYLENGIPPASARESQIFREIDWFVRRWRPQNGVLVAYDRIAMIGPESAPRLTFDRNIRWRTERPDPSFGADGSPLLPPEQAQNLLMEVKIPGAVPVWLADILDRGAIYPASFSKIGSIYNTYLNPFIDSNRRDSSCLTASFPNRRPAALQRPASCSAPLSR